MVSTDDHTFARTIGCIGGILLLAFPLKWCWNGVMPYLFGLPTLTWGKAWCLWFMARLIPDRVDTKAIIEGTQ